MIAIQKECEKDAFEDASATYCKFSESVELCTGRSSHIEPEVEEDWRSDDIMHMRLLDVPSWRNGSALPSYHFGCKPLSHVRQMLRVRAPSAVWVTFLFYFIRLSGPYV